MGCCEGACPLQLPLNETTLEEISALRSRREQHVDFLWLDRVYGLTRQTYARQAFVCLSSRLRMDSLNEIAGETMNTVST